jgi:hypothetical protein
MGKSNTFADFVELTRLLKSIHVGSLSSEERKAFMINLYNSLTVHGLVNGLLGDAASSMSRMKFYASASYVVSGVVLSLNDIEHGILRGNKKSPLYLSSEPFACGDHEHLALCVDLDPRIHFALNCGAKGCPPIAVYSASSLDSQLDRATRSYLSETVIDAEKNSISISMLFKWYQSDFGKCERDIISWIEKHASSSLSNNIKECREKHKVDPTILYLPYDMNLPVKR